MLGGLWSLSARRAWIEITYVTRLPRVQVVALRKESVDRNTLSLSLRPVVGLSLSARRAWIEIGSCLVAPVLAVVALRKESVDRNVYFFKLQRSIDTVALRKESVDRNFDAMQIIVVVVVALRKESVDRNAFWMAPSRPLRRSLSARRAWIEIWVTPLK